MATQRVVYLSCISRHPRLLDSMKQHCGTTVIYAAAFCIDPREYVDIRHVPLHFMNGPPLFSTLGRKQHSNT